MPVTLLFVIVIAAGLGAAWFIKGKTKTQQATSAPANVATRRRYAGVEIRCGKNACSSAKGLRHRTLLAATAPTLPLAGCDAGKCTCAYSKCDDRRQDSRRASDFGIEPLIFDGYEKRVSDERREADEADEAANGY